MTTSLDFMGSADFLEIPTPSLNLIDNDEGVLQRSPAIVA